MKKNITIILTIIISVLAIAGLIHAANTFPGSLNGWDDGDIIESDWADALEIKIGIDGSTATGSLDYKTTVNIELQGTASASYLLTGNTIQVGGFASAAYSRFGISATKNTNYITGTDDLLISGDLEVFGTGSFNIASASQAYFGGGLTDCVNATTSKVLWTAATGKFSCGTDQTGTFDATAQDALTWSDGANATNAWTFDLSGTDPVLTFRSGGFDFTGFASVSTNFEAIGYASASKYFGQAFYTAGTEIDCNDAAEGLQWSAGIYTCRTWADADIPDGITVNGGTIGSNNISATSTWTTLGQLTIGDGGDRVDFATDTWDVTNGVFTGLTLGSLNISSAATWTTLGTLTIGDNGDAVNFDTSTWDVSAGVFSGVAGMTGTGDWDLGGAELEISNGTAFTFDTVGEIFWDTTDFQIQIASASANSPRVIPTMVKLWSGSIASTSNEWFSGGRINLPENRDKYNISEIYCDVEAGTSVVINVSSRAGNYDTETVTCGLGGSSDTSIDTNSNYSGFTKASSSLEIGTITGSVNWLTFSIWGLILPE